MGRRWTLGYLMGVKVSVRIGFWLSSLVLLGVLILLGRYVGLGWGTAVFGALAGVMLHWLGDLAHQMGHAAVARRLGYPMAGVVGLWFLVGSYYPRDEPELPAEIHIRRALGGAPVSVVLGLLAALGARLVGPGGGLLWWLLLFVAFENIVVFGLGAFLPLGFTDGSTLLHWWGKRNM